MAIRVVVGAQWGDEGKGKIVDYLAKDARYIVRYQGGNNAGHSIIIGEDKYVLHLIPSGILRKGTRCVLGGGMVIDPLSLEKEIAELRDHKISVSEENLWISQNAHIVLPYHIAVDEMREAGTSAIGTTKRGIGPCYEDKYARRGLRFADIHNMDDFERKLSANVEYYNRYLTAFGGQGGFSTRLLMEQVSAFREAFLTYLRDVEPLLHAADNAGEDILLEGAQGALLDIEHGTYPFVTSSHILPLSALASLGLSAKNLTQVIGVSKAYVTRVGGGPFPSEETGEIGDRLQKIGKEFGATTGRRRRCGWLDLPQLAKACRLAGITNLAVTKLDVLSHFENINVFMGEEANTKRYETFAGWGPLFGAHSRTELPKSCQDFLDLVEQATGAAVSYLSHGAARDAVIEC